MVNSALDTILEREAENAAKGKPSEFTNDEKQEIARVVGLGALKYFLLKVDPRKNMMFNPRESIDFNGNTGPFIQYTYARIQSLLRKANAADLTADFSGVEPNEKEVALIQRLSDFPATIHEAGVTYSPALIANYVYELVKEFNQHYPRRRRCQGACIPSGIVESSGYYRTSRNSIAWYRGSFAHVMGFL